MQNREDLDVSTRNRLPRHARDHVGRRCRPRQRPARGARRGMAHLRRRPRPHPLRRPGPDRRGELQRPRAGVALPHREPRPRPRVRLPVDPADGRRGALHHGRHAARGRRPRRGDGRAALGAPSQRGRAGRRGAAAAVRARPDVLGRRGRRGDFLRHPRLPPHRAERPYGPPRAGLRRERPGRPEAGPRPGARPRHRRDRAARGPGRRRRGRRHRRRPPRGRRARHEGEADRARPRLRRPDRRAAVDLPHHSRRRRVRQRHVAGRLVALYRQHRGVGPDDHRPRAGLRLPAGGDAHRRPLRGAPARRQPVLEQHRRPRPPDRRARVALPDDSPRRMGLRPRQRARPRRHHRRRA